MHRKRVRLKSPLLNVLWCAPYALIDYLVRAHLWGYVTCKILLAIAFLLKRLEVCVKTKLVKVNEEEK
jgi:hypothetical protein